MIVLQSAPSWDLVITLSFVIGITYGFIMLRDKVLVTLLSLYAANVIATSLAEPVQKFFNGDVALLNKIWVQSSASPFTIKLVIFGAVLVIIGAKGGLAGRRSGFSMFELAAYSFFNVCIALASIFSFMTPDQLKGFTETSHFARLIIDHRLVWFVAPLVILAVMGRAPHMGNSYHPDY